MWICGWGNRVVRTTEGKTATFVADGDLLSTNGISDLGSRLGQSEGRARS